MVDQIHGPLAIDTFGEFTDEPVVTDYDSIAVLLHSTWPRLEISLFYEFTKALEDVEAHGDFHKTFLYT